MNITLRKATEDDEAFVRTCHHTAYHDVVVEQFGEWDEERQEQYFEQKWNPEEIDLVMYGASSAGYLIVETHVDYMFLSEIVLLPDFQKQGIGTKLMKDQIAHAVSLGLPLRLRVLKANRAITLYERLGFREYGETETHIQMEIGE